jgi:hypothetical protein
MTPARLLLSASQFEMVPILVYTPDGILPVLAHTPVESVILLSSPPRSADRHLRMQRCRIALLR